MKKQVWTSEEDAVLQEIVEKHGSKNWRFIASHLSNRTPIQCRDRWTNRVNPAINREPFRQEEDELLLKLVKRFGSSWSTIASHFSRRTDCAVKNRYCVLQRRRVSGRRVKTSSASPTRSDDTTPPKNVTHTSIQLLASETTHASEPLSQLDSTNQQITKPARYTPFASAPLTPIDNKHNFMLPSVSTLLNNNQSQYIDPWQIPCDAESFQSPRQDILARGALPNAKRELSLPSQIFDSQEPSSTRQQWQTSRATSTQGHTQQPRRLPISESSSFCGDHEYCLQTSADSFAQATATALYSPPAGPAVFVLLPSAAIIRSSPCNRDTLGDHQSQRHLDSNSCISFRDFVNRL